MKDLEQIKTLSKHNCIRMNINTFHTKPGKVEVNNELLFENK